MSDRQRVSHYWDIMLIVFLVSYSLVVMYSLGHSSNDDVCQRRINEMSTRFEKDKLDLQQKIEHQQERMNHQQEYFERRLEEMEKRLMSMNGDRGSSDITKRLLLNNGPQVNCKLLHLT